MRIYISASFIARDRLRPIRDRLIALGYDVATSWLDQVASPKEMDPAIFHKKLALQDFIEASAADLMIQDTLTDSTTGGLHVEWGIGLARFQRQLLWVVGPYKNLFHQLADEHFDDWNEALLFLTPDDAPVLADVSWLERESPND